MKKTLFTLICILSYFCFYGKPLNNTIGLGIGKNSHFNAFTSIVNGKRIDTNRHYYSNLNYYLEYNRNISKKIMVGSTLNYAKVRGEYPYNLTHKYSSITLQLKYQKSFTKWQSFSIGTGLEFFHRVLNYDSLILTINNITSRYNYNNISNGINIPIKFALHSQLTDSLQLSPCFLYSRTILNPTIFTTRIETQSNSGSYSSSSSGTNNINNYLYFGLSLDWKF